MLVRAGQRAVVELIHLPADIGGAKGGLGCQGRIGKVLPNAPVKQLRGRGGVLGGVRLGGFGFELGSRAIKQLIALRGARAHDALVADPARGRARIFGFGIGELGRFIRIFLLAVSIPKDVDPGTIVGVNDEFTAGDDGAEGWIGRVRDGIHVGGVEHGCAIGVVNGSFRAALLRGQSDSQGGAGKQRESRATKMHTGG